MSGAKIIQEGAEISKSENQQVSKRDYVEFCEV
jgi:hypothetical protein